MNPAFDLRPLPYRRMSTDKQDNSPARQTEVIRDGCHSLGVELVQVDDALLDEAMTGTTNNRPALLRIIAKGKQWGANAVAVDQMSRISRTDALEAAAEVYHPLRRAGMRYIIDCSKGTIHDLHDTNCILFVTIEQGHGSHAESRSIAHRVASGVKTLKEQGYVFGRKPPRGYRIVDRRKNKFGGLGCGKLAIVPEEAAVIRRVFELYQQIRSAPRVAKEMGWLLYEVERVLNQAIYCGRMATKPRKSVAKFESVTGVREAGAEGNVYRNKEEVEYQDGVYPQIVSPAEWDRCQAIMKANRDGGLKRQFRGGKYKGKIFCLECGRPMHSQFDRYQKSEKRKLVYLCASHNRQMPVGAHRCAKGKRVMESQIDEAVEEARTVYLASMDLTELVEKKEEDHQAIMQEIDAERKKKEARKAALEVRKREEARSLLRLADAPPETVAAALAAHEETLKEERELAKEMKECVAVEEVQRAIHERWWEAFEWARQGHMEKLVSRISVMFETHIRKSRQWRNPKGEIRGGHERAGQIPHSCLIEFHSFPSMTYRFQPVVSTTGKGQHGIAHTD